MPKSSTPPDTVIHTLGATWTQDDLGEELAIGPVSVIGTLDPTGAEGTVNELMASLLASLEPMLNSFERHRGAGSAAGIGFVAHKHQSAAGQLGAMRLSASCRAITAYFSAGGSVAPGPLEPVLDALVDTVVVENVRLQRRLRMLLA